MPEIEALCNGLKEKSGTLTYNDAQRELEKAGFMLDEYGGGHYGNPYAVFVHPCGIVVDIEYTYTKVRGSKDSWLAGQITAFGWVNDPNYHRHCA